MTQTNEERALTDTKYLNSRRGFIVTKISDVFKPSHYKVREGRNTCWKPDCTKEDVYQKVMNYIIIMQERFPQTDGYICCYCKKPWTFFSNPTTRGIGHKKRSKASPATDSNFAIDRWDSRITYEYNNLRFCCLGCNNRKSSSTPSDWDNYREASHDYR